MPRFRMLRDHLRDNLHLMQLEQYFVWVRQIVLSLQHIHHCRLAHLDLSSNSVYVVCASDSLVMGGFKKTSLYDADNTHLLPPVWREMSNNLLAYDIFQLGALMWEMVPKLIYEIPDIFSRDQFGTINLNLPPIPQALDEFGYSPYQDCMLECLSYNPNRLPALDDILAVVDGALLYCREQVQIIKDHEQKLSIHKCSFCHERVFEEGSRRIMVELGCVDRHLVCAQCLVKKGSSDTLFCPTCKKKISSARTVNWRQKYNLDEFESADFLNRDI